MSGGNARRIVGRLAPTPSAKLHVGNLFSMMMAWLLAKSAGGQVVLRIEDLDYERCKPEYSDAVRRDLELLGLSWDNEQVVYQHGRTERYEAALGVLEDCGLVYPCYCSRADLHAASAPHVGERYLYAGTCRNLTAAERAERSQRRNPAMRLAVPDEVVSFHDGLQGRIAQNLAGECGDFIVRRSDMVFAYQLAVVVDDLAQGVNQVVRGCDLADSTPQQIYLRRLLQQDAPEVEYWHIPLLVDGEGRRLSKREHDQTLDGLLEVFTTPEHLIGYLAGITGIAPTTEPLAMHELLDAFSVEALRGKQQITWTIPDKRP